jgi:hypothetical protein
MHGRDYFSCRLDQQFTSSRSAEEDFKRGVESYANFFFFWETCLYIGSHPIQSNPIQANGIFIVCYSIYTVMIQDYVPCQMTAATLCPWRCPSWCALTVRWPCPPPPLCPVLSGVQWPPVAGSSSQVKSSQQSFI